MKATIVITDWGFPSLDPERETFAPYDVTIQDYQCKTEEEVTSVVKDADVVLTQWAPVKVKAISAMKRCRGIVRYGIGLDNVDVVAAEQRGIPVRNVPDYCLDEVADHTLALILALQRQVHVVDKLVRSGTWKITPPRSLSPLRSCTLGLIGFGRIAQLVAQRAHPFKLRIVASDPFVGDSVFSRQGVERKSVEAVFAEADVLSLHCPLTSETHYLVNRRTLALMKPTAFVVNTSRGGLVDTRALIEALKHNRLAGAGLDVVEEEPLQIDHELLAEPNVVITSHVAWYSSLSAIELQKKAALASLELLGLR